MRSLLLPLLLLCSSLSAETGYRFVHPDGTVEFSDQPIPEAEEIKLRPVPTIEFVPAPPSVTKPSAQADGKSGEIASGTIIISSPKSGETLWFDESGVTVAVAVTPSLQSGQQITISLDGKEISRGSSLSFNLGSLSRGSYTLKASVVNAAGGILFSSSSIDFNVRQRSVIKR